MQRRSAAGILRARGAHIAAGLVVRLDDAHRDAGLRERDRGSKAVGARPDHYRVGLSVLAGHPDASSGARPRPAA